MGEQALAGGTRIDPAAIYTVVAAGAAVGFGETFIRGEIREGRLVARRVGKRVLRIKGTDLQTWYDGWITITESTASCEPPKDGSQSGATEQITESALASVTRG